MCIMAILYRSARDAPILVASNREEFYDRQSQPPRIQSGKPRVICGIDRRAGGTWLGVNQYGLLVAVTNRAKAILPPEPRSRGLLCRDLLSLRNATEAADHAARELATGNYAGASTSVWMPNTGRWSTAATRPRWSSFRPGCTCSPTATWTIAMITGSNLCGVCSRCTRSHRRSLFWPWPARPFPAGRTARAAVA